MKKLISIVLVLACVMTCVFALTGCDFGGAPEFYGKKITFSGNALPILWDKKCNLDSGPDNHWDESKHDFADKTEYSYRELLTKYWDKIDFEHDDPEIGSPWSSMKGKTVDEFIAEVDKGLEGFFDRWMDLSHWIQFEFGTKTDRTVKVTLREDVDEEIVYTSKFVENAEQLNAIKSEFDPRAEYLNWVQTPVDEGHWCLVFVDFNEDGLLDGYFELMLTQYVVHGDKPTAELSVCMIGSFNVAENKFYSRTYSFAQMNSLLSLWAYPTANGAISILQLPFYPEIIVE